MSRSYCKPRVPFHIQYKGEIQYIEGKRNYKFGVTYGDLFYENCKDIINKKYKYYTKKTTSHYHSYRFPKSYRKTVNRSRRNFDKRELHKELTYNDYEGLYSKWNGKDSDPMWYW